MGQRITGGLISITANGVMPPGASNASTLHTLSPGRVGTRALIRKIMWINRTLNDTFLRIGYENLVAAPGGPNFIQVLPDILMVSGVDGEMVEDDIPICGNGPEGFQADTTALTGSTGAIMAESVAAGAVPNDVQVRIEVEEF